MKENGIHPLRWVACFLLATLLQGLPAVAQTGSAISGTVFDESGAAVSAASVTARNLNTGAERSTATDAGGAYQILALPVGDYEVTAHRSGFADEVRTGIHLAVGQDAVADLRLHAAGVQERVVVHADADAVSVTTSDVSGLVREQEVRSLPLNGRSYDELLTLNPGVVNFTAEKTGGIGVSNSTVGNNFSVSGNRPQQNLFLLNGIEFTGAAENNMQPGGTSQQMLGVDSVREFNVLRDDYSAEYGKRPGAQLLIVTAGGTNQMHGSAFEFLRNSALDARNYFKRAAVPPFQRNQFGTSMGGPLQRHTFAFGNYEGFRQHLHQAGVALVPDANARAGMLPCK
ncbi:MAG TPA: carboxypeptidase-like regulatory domain-containing protein, partial [Acidobacteriaceae bacterium]|nr:carboxypeptidase-like regulatory domain-containing protein [Acidobacteriaceae bacterium]